MFREINIQVIVDVVKALSEGSLEGNVFMMDTSPKSRHQGTDRLMTACHPGQVVHWDVRAVDVQTPIQVTDISIRRGGHCDWRDEEGWGSERYSDKRWTGRISLPVGLYHYAVTLEMGNGRHSVMVLETASLKVLSRSSRHGSRQRCCGWQPPAICPPYYPYWPYSPQAAYCPPYPPPVPCPTPYPPYGMLPPWYPPAPWYPDGGACCEPDWDSCPCDRGACGCRPEPWDGELVPQPYGSRPPACLLPPSYPDPEEVP